MNLQPISADILIEKYAKHGETTQDEIYSRVAAALASVESEPEVWAPVFHNALEAGFIPAGRIMSAAGTDIQATLLNCFVQPIGDSISEPDASGKPGIYTALLEAAETMRRGGGVGYDFSRIRPKGAMVKGTASMASGPVSYMRVFDRSCETVESAGSRRGAQMGVLRCDHPAIEEFIHAKDKAGELTNFNISVGILDAFMEAVEQDQPWQLVHAAEPSEEMKALGAFQRDDQLWVYKTVSAKALFDDIMRSTYDHAEPGVLFLDTANRENNLQYTEVFEACNPCAEEFLPDYGCCCLGSINLTKLVKNPFTAGAWFDYPAFRELISVAVRMLDNVLDLSFWPLTEQYDEAMKKRRIGLGFTGLGDTLIMLNLRYNTEPGYNTARLIAEILRNGAYDASIELAKNKGAFPLFDSNKYCSTPFIQRLSRQTQAEIAEHGIRNSHLLAIAPTGTISLAFADNASNGIEPPFSWFYSRKKRVAGSNERVEYTVEDHAYRLYKSLGGDLERMPEAWITALEIPALDHMRMLAEIQPFIDTSISKTCNIPEDYPFEDFESLYFQAWKAGLKGLATYRPNSITGAVLSAPVTEPTPAAVFDSTDPDRRLQLIKLPEPALASLKWRKRPRPLDGNMAKSYMVDYPGGSFAIFIGELAEQEKIVPFEVWAFGAEVPRGLGALAKSLSLDMRANDRGWIEAKLDSLAKTASDDGFILAMPGSKTPIRVPSVVAGFAALVRYRCDELGFFDGALHTPILDALLSRKEPKTGADGTLAWTVDIANPATGDDFVLYMKELVLPNGQRRPYSVWFSGEYPQVFNGLTKSLSLDMRVVDPAWIALKLRQLRDFPEPRGDFLAWAPKLGKKQSYPSTVAYIAEIMLSRYEQLGILNEGGYPVEAMGVVAHDGELLTPQNGGAEITPQGKRCPECGQHAVIKKDGCEFCQSCGWVGACG